MNRDPIATLIHISDLHFGKNLVNNYSTFHKIYHNIPFTHNIAPHNYYVVRALSHRVNDILSDRKKRKIPNSVVFCGDLTRFGDKNEFITGGTFLRSSHATGTSKGVGLTLGNDKTKITLRSSPKLLHAPGNHDIFGRNNPQEMAYYQRFFPGKYPKEWIIPTNSRPIYLYSLNSTENTSKQHKLARGLVLTGQLEDLTDKLKDRKQDYPNSIRIVFLHHTLIDAANKWDPRMVLVNRKEVASNLVGLAHLVLSGHVHKYDFVPAGKNFPNHAIVGTATQINQTNSFLLIDIFKNEISITPYVYDKLLCRFKSNNGKKGSVINIGLRDVRVAGP